MSTANNSRIAVELEPGADPIRSDPIRESIEHTEDRDMGKPTIEQLREQVHGS